jgi:hypothetical protein
VCEQEYFEYKNNTFLLSAKKTRKNYACEGVFSSKWTKIEHKMKRKEVDTGRINLRGDFVGK